MGGKRVDQPSDHRLRQPCQGVDGGHSNHAGADEPHLRAPDCNRVGIECLADGGGLHCREDRDGDHPRNHLPDQHRHANRESDEMAGTEESQ